MRRVLTTAVLATLAFSACASQERPEGIVERWLLALNQGSAGEPGRFAPESLSQTILPGWSRADPGHFDVIEVSPAAVRSCSDAVAGDSCEAQGRRAFVRFNLETTEGAVFSFEVTLVEHGGTWNPIALEPNDDPMVLRNTGWLSKVKPSSWLAAIGIGFGLVLAGEGLMRLARRRRPD
ncbi:MAG: hypothetical protein ACRDGO_02035 [Actinomycetota bacterium]